MSLFRPQLWRIPTTGEAERRQLPELTATLETRLKHIARRSARCRVGSPPGFESGGRLKNAIRYRRIAKCSTPFLPKALWARIRAQGTFAGSSPPSARSPDNQIGLWSKSRTYRRKSGNGSAWSFQTRCEIWAILVQNTNAINSYFYLFAH